MCISSTTITELSLNFDAKEYPEKIAEIQLHDNLTVLNWEDFTDASQQATMKWFIYIWSSFKRLVIIKMKK